MLTLGRMVRTFAHEMSRSLRFIGLFLLVGFPLAIIAPNAPVPVAGLALLIAAVIWKR